MASLRADAESLYWSGEFDGAQVVLSRALAQARALCDTGAEAALLTRLGLAAWRLGDYRAARQLGEDALTLKLRAGLEDQLFRSYNALGLLAWNESRLSEAAESYAQATEAARNVGDARGVAVAALNLGLVKQDLGQLAGSRRAFSAAVVSGRELGDARVEANALNNLAALDILVGDPLAAIESLNEALRLYQSIDYVTGIQNALGQLATAHAALGEPSRAFALLDSALEMSRAQGLRQEEVSNLELLGDFHRAAGNPRRALQLYGDARVINEGMGLRYEMGVDLRSEAEIYASLGDLELARRKAAAALEIHRETGARFEEFADLLLLAELAQEAGDSRDIESYLSDARQLAAELRARTPRMSLALAEARIAEREGEPRQVLRALDRAAADLAAGGYGVEWEAQALRARAYAELDSLKAAVDAGRAAVAAVERVRGRHGSGMLRTAYLSDKADVYADLVRLLIRAGRVEEAFEVADAARGRALLEHLAVARRDLVGSSGIAGEFAEGEELLGRIDELVESLEELEVIPPEERDPEVVVEADRLFAELQRTRAEYEALLVRAAERDPAAATMLGVAPASVAEIKAALRPDEALLEYLVTDDRVVLFVLRDSGVECLESQVSASELATQVRIARNLIGRPRSERGPPSAVLGRLHEILVSPALHSGALDGAARLLIVAHRELNYLPFAALRDQASGRYLVQDYALLNIPTSAALPVIRASGRGGDVASVQAFAPFPEKLPATREEVRAFERAVPGASARIGRRASEAELRKALLADRLVHVASHGVLNATSPLFSRVELAGSARGGSADDGRLEVHELLGLSIRSHLVFLSGCETGVGAAWSTKFARGEDYATLAQAFLYAGAGNVVATLWRVEDEGAAAFAANFYRELEAIAPVKALARAQRHMIADSSYKAPFYWAAYVVSGSGQLGAQSQNPTAESVQP